VRQLLVRSLLGGLAGGLALTLAASALAAGGLTVSSHYWEVGIANGPSHKVAAGESFTYCPSGPVADIEAKITFTHSPAGKPYSVAMVGPKAAGKTITSFEGDFHGGGGTINPTYLSLGFPKLKKDNVVDLIPGTYRFTLLVAGKPALRQTLKLVERGGC
jgi:hypothetical protein